MINDLRHKYCYECYSDWHLCICEEGAQGFSFATQPEEEKMIIAGMTLTKRGEKVLITFATFVMLLVAVMAGTIETMS